MRSLRRNESSCNVKFIISRSSQLPVGVTFSKTYNRIHSLLLLTETIPWLARSQGGALRDPSKSFFDNTASSSPRSYNIANLL